MKRWQAALYLENGHLFQGWGFGAQESKGGEAVFNTGMSGYQEIFTDPSYFQQIVVMTYPHIGNTGVNTDDVESNALYLKGVVARDYCHEPSSWRAQSTLSDYLKKAHVPGIFGVDSRKVTQILRDEGAQRAVIFPAETSESSNLISQGKSLLESVPAMQGQELVSQVSTSSPYEFSPAKVNAWGHAVVYDYGVKHNILHEFKQRQFKVTVVPYNFPHQDVLGLKPSAVVLSNGPGDPATVPGAAKEIESLLGKVPIFAICMGHQLLARALGGSTYKLKFGHHGINHPVKDLKSGRIVVTSQNHGFSVRMEDLKQTDSKLTHISLNDQTTEGFESLKLRFHSVQFHPESKPGPSDASYLFDNFVRGFLK